VDPRSSVAGQPNTYSCTAPPCDRQVACGIAGGCTYKSSAVEAREQDKLRLEKMTAGTAKASPAVRTFATGATRDTDQNKYDYEGFVSPLVLERFAQYMNKNRHQRDGSLRDSDNWQKGIPFPVYMKSMWRHFMDVWFHHRNLPAMAKDTLEDSLCALLFNVQGYLHELLKTKSA
jgi:hypothetical protein